MEHICRQGGRIAYIRARTVRMLNDYMKIEMKRISNGKEESELIYKTYTESHHRPMRLIMSKTLR